MVAKKHSVDVSRLPKTFDWEKYCIYESVFFRVLEVSYNPFIKELFLTDSEMDAPGEVYSGWLKFADVPVENRVYIYIGEKIPYRADGRDKFYKK